MSYVLKENKLVKLDEAFIQKISMESTGSSVFFRVDRRGVVIGVEGCGSRYHEFNKVLIEKIEQMSDTEKGNFLKSMQNDLAGVLLGVLENADELINTSIKNYISSK